MARDTDRKYRNQVIYSVFVRNYSDEGTFNALRRDLQRIRNLGTDILWLMPIHPIGIENRKGKSGSPYAISDYRSINPEYGTLEDFKNLVDDIHFYGMKCVIDVVFNHTSPDSWLRVNHPEWFYRKPDGSFGNKVGEWLDVIDLDYSNMPLWKYLIETLEYWAKIVDGFRCDVAPLIPLDFWLEARRRIELIHPGFFWLSESVEPIFTIENRSRGMVSLSDSEILQAFDACYDYDIFGLFMRYLKGEIPLSRYAEGINQQEAIYPDNYIKLRFLENHDRPRAAFLFDDEETLINWTAFLYFQKGMTLLYAGQEIACRHLPSLFEKDPINWYGSKDLSGLLKTLYTIKQKKIFSDSRYEVKACPFDIMLASHAGKSETMYGVFSLRGNSAVISIAVPDGTYLNLIDKKPFEIHHGMMHCKGLPVIFCIVKGDNDGGHTELSK